MPYVTSLNTVWCVYVFSFLYLQQTGKDSALAVTTKLKCAAGLAELTTSKYKSAARYFLLTNFDHCDFPNVSMLSVVTCFFILYLHSML